MGKTRGSYFLCVRFENCTKVHKIEDLNCISGDREGEEGLSTQFTFINISFAIERSKMNGKKESFF